MGLYKRKLSIIYYVLLISSLSWCVFRPSVEPETAKRTPYNNVCNVLRSDEKCIEQEDKFVCHQSIVYGDQSFSKNICVNETGGNNEYSFVKLRSEYLGQSFTSDRPLVYVQNLRRNNCSVVVCGFKYENQLQDLDYVCTRCFQLKLMTPIRISLIPAQTKFTVVDAFKLEGKPSFNKVDFLVLEDERGNRSEIAEYKYRSFTQPLIKSKSAETDEILKDAKEFHNSQKIEKTYCLLEDHNKPAPHQRDPNKKFIYSPDIEIRILKLAHDFQFRDDFKITDLYWWKLKYHMADQKRSCAKVVFTDFKTYLTFKIFSSDWNLEYAIPDMNTKLEGRKTFPFKSLKELEEKVGYENYLRI